MPSPARRRRRRRRAGRRPPPRAPGRGGAPAEAEEGRTTGRRSHGPRVGGPGRGGRWRRLPGRVTGPHGRRRASGFAWPGCVGQVPVPVGACGARARGEGAKKFFLCVCERRWPRPGGPQASSSIALTPFSAHARTHTPRRARTSPPSHTHTHTPSPTTMAADAAPPSPSAARPAPKAAPVMTAGLYNEGSVFQRGMNEVRRECGGAGQGLWGGRGRQGPPGARAVAGLAEAGGRRGGGAAERKTEFHLDSPARPVCQAPPAPLFFRKGGGVTPMTPPPHGPHARKQSLPPRLTS